MTDSFDTSLTHSIAVEQLADLLGDVSEITIDSALEDGTLRDIPIVGVVFGLAKAVRDIRDKLFLRKIVVFLKELSTIPLEERRQFIERYDSKEKQHKFGQAVLLLLDRAEDLQKPHLIARILKAHILGELDEARAWRLCAIVNRCYTQDLDLLRNFEDGTQGEAAPIAESLLSAGLLSLGGADSGGPGDDGGMIFCLNEYGKLLVEFAL